MTPDHLDPATAARVPRILVPTFGTAYYPTPDLYTRNTACPTCGAPTPPAEPSKALPVFYPLWSPMCFAPNALCPPPETGAAIGRFFDALCAAGRELRSIITGRV